MSQPLHEVWGSFTRALRMLAFDGAFKSITDSEADTVPGIKYSEQKVMLREVLLHRCNNHLFEWEHPDDGGKSSLVDYHMDYAAYHSFLAWEYGQRAIEAQKGGGE